MKFVERLTGIILKPGETMKDIIKEPRIEEALVIVAVYAIFYMLYAYVLSTRTKYVYNIPGMESVSGLQTITTIFTLVFSLVAPLIVWLIVSGILHLFAMAFGGSGKFYPHILTGIGYSDIVKIFFVIIAMLLLTQVPVHTVEISQSSLSSVSSVVKDMYSNPFYILSTIIVLIGMVWSCYLGALAIKEGEKLTMTQALLVVGIPLIIYLVISYGTLVLGFL